MNQLSVEAIKKFNVNELKSELAKQTLAVQGKKKNFRYVSRTKSKNTRNSKKHEENVMPIINDKISSINQRLDKLKLDINNNLTIINKVRSKTNDLTLSLETSQNIWETENKKLKEVLTNLRHDLKEKDVYLKNQRMRILEDRYSR